MTIDTIDARVSNWDAKTLIDELIKLHKLPHLNNDTKKIKKAIERRLLKERINIGRVYG